MNRDADSTDGHHPPGAVDVADMTSGQRANLRRAIAASATGNMVEWLDYGIYAFMAMYIATVFFPETAGTAGVLYTFMVLAVSFAARPLGGLVLGPLGDRFGRKRLLVVTITMMTMATAAIGVLPTYDSAGIAAPALLILCRLIQGFSAGGEYSGAAIFMSEHAPDRRRGFYASFLEFGTLAGTCTAAGLTTCLVVFGGDAWISDGGWRWAFLGTLPLAVVALIFRYKVEDSPVFEEALAANELTRPPLRTSLLYWRQMLILFLIVASLNSAFYVVLSLMPTYLSATLGHSFTGSMMTLIVIMLLMMAVITPLGALSDRIGRKPMLYASTLGYALFSVPLFWMVNGDSAFLQVVALAGLGLIMVVMAATTSSSLPALFPTDVRYSSFAISYNTSTALLGGTAPAIITFLIERTGSSLMPGWYLTVMGAVAFVAVLFMKETAGRSLRGLGIPGDDAPPAAQAGARPRLNRPSVADA